jgi:hypothetical protein
MLQASSLKSFYPLVATPCYGGSLFYTYVISIIRLIGAANQAGMPIDFHYRAGDSLVTRARNDCVAEFLSAPKYTHLFWIDGDIGFEPQAALRLLLADRDVVAGAYPFKRENWPPQGVPAGTTRLSFEEQYTSYPVNTGGEASTSIVHIAIDTDGFFKVHDAPTGFMLIKRSVFDRLIERFPDYKYVPDWPEGTYPVGGMHYRFFDTMVDPVSRRYLSEDYAFCRLLQTIGVDMYIDANSKLTHMGSKLYSGNLGKTLSLAPANAIGAIKGAQIRVTGLESLK